MGSENYEFFVPYQKDINKVLQELREQIFADGDYRFYEPAAGELEEELSLLERRKGRLTQSDYEQQRTSLQSKLDYYQQNPPKSIVELLERAGGSTSWSIIDIKKVSTEPRTADWADHLDMVAYANTDDYVFTLYPIALSDIEAVFGTSKPTHEMVQNDLDGPFSFDYFCDRNEAVYLVVYEDDQPSEIFIFGVAADR